MSIYINDVVTFTIFAFYTDLVMPTPLFHHAPLSCDFLGFDSPSIPSAKEGATKSWSCVSTRSERS